MLGVYVYIVVHGLAFSCYDIAIYIAVATSVSAGIHTAMCYDAAADMFTAACCAIAMHVDADVALYTD